MADLGFSSPGWSEARCVIEPLPPERRDSKAAARAQLPDDRVLLVNVSERCHICPPLETRIKAGNLVWE